jgi:hypothetical protein
MSIVSLIRKVFEASRELRLEAEVIQPYPKGWE